MIELKWPTNRKVRGEDNIKELYRRGNAYALVRGTKKMPLGDLRKAVKLDLSLHNTVEEKLQTFAAAIKEKDSIQKE